MDAFSHRGGLIGYQKSPDKQRSSQFHNRENMKSGYDHSVKKRKIFFSKIHMFMNPPREKTQQISVYLNKKRINDIFIIERNNLF